MSSITYTITQNFTSGFLRDKFANEILNSSLSNLFYKLKCRDNDIIVVFSETLSAENIAILDALVAGHNSTPAPKIGRNIISHTFSDAVITNNNYTSVGLIKYPGAAIARLETIDFIGHMNTSATSYWVRIKDSANNTIVEQQYTNVTSALCSFSAIAYRPSIDTIFDVQVKVAGTSGANAAINSFALQYN